MPKQKCLRSNVANTFYRVGISGIEYFGMIRKMAAINLYIRGLNPANIEQGDSLDFLIPVLIQKQSQLLLLILLSAPNLISQLTQRCGKNIQNRQHYAFCKADV